MPSAAACIPRAIFGAPCDHIASEDDVAEEAMQRALVPPLYRALRALPEQRLREVVVLRFGLLGSDPHSLREIAEHWGVSPATVLTVERRALTAMRDLI